MSTRQQQLTDAAARVNLHVRTYSPGDGVARYRFFTNPANSYFGPDNGIATVLGIGAAETWVSAYAAGRHSLALVTLNCKKCGKQFRSTPDNPHCLRCDAVAEVAP